LRECEDRMKKYNLKLITDIPLLEQIDIGGKRHYTDSEGIIKNPYPSVTTVLSADPSSKKGLDRWRKRVGEQEANRVSTQALSKGNDVHEMIECHILGEEQKKMMPNVRALFAGLRDVADARIDNVRMVEGQMFSHHLQVAGTVDLVAEFDGRLSIIDWKTSSKEKPRKFINNYFKQESAYAVMFEERTGIPVDQLVTIIAHPEGTQVFVEHRDNWIEGFMDLRKLYAEQQGRLE